jgi:hypothetical protein
VLYNLASTHLLYPPAGAPYLIFKGGHDSTLAVLLLIIRAAYMSLVLVLCCCAETSTLLLPTWCYCGADSTILLLPASVADNLLTYLPTLVVAATAVADGGQAGEAADCDRWLLLH